MYLLRLPWPVTISPVDLSLMTLTVLSSTGEVFCRVFLDLSDVSMWLDWCCKFLRERTTKVKCHFYHIMSRLPKINRSLKNWICPRRWVTMPNWPIPRNWPCAPRIGWGRSCGLDVSSRSLSPHPSQSVSFI